MFYPISSGSIALSLKIKFKTSQKLSCSQGITQTTTQTMMMEPKTIYVSPGWGGGGDIIVILKNAMNLTLQGVIIMNHIL